MADKQKQPQVDEGEEVEYDPQAEVVGDWKKVDLPEIPVISGQEEEDTLIKLRSKVYRWRGQWKQRGVGELKMLKHKKSNLIRILVRAEKTHKCLLNHLIQAKDIFCKLQKMKTSNNAWIWAAYDISDEKPNPEKFCAKFTSKDDFDIFQKQFNKACQENAKILDSDLKKVEKKEQQ